MAAMKDISPNLTGDGEPQRSSGKRVTANFFSVLGVSPFMGSDFRPEEDQPGMNRVAIVSYGMWLTRFGGDPQIVGKQIVLDNQNYIVKGVMPRGFQFEDRGDEIWAPLGLSAAELQLSRSALPGSGRPTEAGRYACSGKFRARDNSRAITKTISEYQWTCRSLCSAVARSLDRKNCVSQFYC